MKSFLYGFLFLIVLLPIIILFKTCSYASKVEQVVMNEIDPQTILNRYMWFKDASAELDRKRADLIVVSNQIKALEEAYKGVERRLWPRDDREQHGLLTQQFSGMKSAYNQLAGLYNSNMTKINFKFCNMLDLPKGATVVLPREYVME